jgi:alpha-glucosidase (family GH31 glycosyl hydrolase)
LSEKSENSKIDYRCSTVDPSNKYDFPPWVPQFLPNKNLGGKTIPMSATHSNGVNEYYCHNLYGLMESACTNAAITSVFSAIESESLKRSFVLSRSTFPSSGRSLIIN